MIWREMDWSKGYTEAWHEVLWALGKVVTGGRLCQNKGLLTTGVKPWNRRQARSKCMLEPFPSRPLFPGCPDCVEVKTDHPGTLGT